MKIGPLGTITSLTEGMLCALIREFFVVRARKEGIEYPDTPLVFQASSARAARVLYATKLRPLDSLGLERAEARNQVSIFGRGGLVTPAYGAIVACEATRQGADVYFVGDLDPWDMAVFLTLAVELRKHATNVHYLGVGATWPESCRANRKKSIPATTALIQLDRFESALLRRLNQLPVAWNRILGASGCRILRSGFKLELEGATNPGLYTKHHQRTLRELLIGPASSASNDSTGQD